MTTVEFVKKLIEIEFDVHTEEEIDKIFDKFYTVVPKEEYKPKHLKNKEKHKKGIDRLRKI